MDDTTARNTKTCFEVKKGFVKCSQFLHEPREGAKEQLKLTD